MSVAIKIVHCNEGFTTPFDGQYLVEYDPTREGQDPDGRPMFAHLVTTPNRKEAMEFPSVTEALELWRKQHGIRTDGEPNRPLTAFTVTFE